MMIFKFARPLAWLLLALILFVTVSPIGLRPETMTTVDTDLGGAFVLVGLAFALGYPKQWKMLASSSQASGLANLKIIMTS
ncbi:VanZ family protein, partial [Rhizobium leguminosarum]